MNNLKTTIKSIFLLILTFYNFNIALAQDYKVALADSKLIVLGTSNLHDWEIDAKSMSGKSNLSLEAGELKAIKSLDFSVEVEQLKSGKKGMDNNTYKALNSAMYKNITYKLTNVSKISKSSDNYTVETIGDLTICGVTKKINQSFQVKIIGKKAIFNGKTKIDMTTYGVKPPTALLGTIKTGKDVTVNFNIAYN